MKGKPKVRAIKSDEFLSLVTHEIKNPLTSITGFTHFAEDAVKNHDVNLALESLQVVRCEAQRVLRLAEDLLDVAQVSAGKFSVQMESVDLQQIVWEIAGRYAVKTGRQIAVQTPEVFPCIVGDGARLAQVVENLVSNATKYSPEETPIRIAITAADCRLILTVWNGGPTIPADDIPRMFQRFCRAGNGNGHGHGNGKGNGKAVKGNGLGLYISKQIVELHGGSISVQSEEGKGTTFTVELPRQQAWIDAEAV